jgi:hypothetical protein
MGLPSQYVSFSPDNKGKLCIRLCFPQHSNERFTFPGHGPTFPASHGGSTTVGEAQAQEILFPLDEHTNMTSLIGSSPMAAAQYFILAIEAVWNGLYGIKMARQYKVTRPLARNNPGILGCTKGLVMVTEVNENKNFAGLHSHALVYGSLDPELLRIVASIPSFAKLVLDKMEAIYRQELPESVHVKDLIARIMNSWSPPDPRPSCSRAPNPVTETVAYFNKVYITYCFVQIHRHLMTCLNGKNGETGCRLGILYNLVSMSGVRVLYFLVCDKDHNVNPEDIPPSATQIFTANFNQDNLKQIFIDNNNSYRCSCCFAFKYS